MDYSSTLFSKMLLLWGPESANSLLAAVEAEAIDVVRINSLGIRATEFHLNFTQRVDLVYAGWSRSVAPLLHGLLRSLHG